MKNVVFPDHAAGSLPLTAAPAGTPPEFTHIGISGFAKSARDEADTGFIMTWAAKGRGFGELAFVQKPDGTIECESETMGKKFIEAALKALVEKIILK